ncbi:PAR14-like protein [Mya arenaria]|uniref:PAR14-like protein n=1 Tax=Mya arenaria TaxID=6604 RepID=A0ABY7EKT8_MYAAR|nr:PAR14-like protein [Mya arenaria]
MKVVSQKKVKTGTDDARHMQGRFKVAFMSGSNKSDPCFNMRQGCTAEAECVTDMKRVPGTSVRVGDKRRDRRCAWRGTSIIIITKVDEIASENCFTFNDNVTRAHIFKILRQSVRKAKRQNSFPVRAIDNLNNFNENIVCSDSVISFEARWTYPGPGEILTGTCTDNRTEEESTSQYGLNLPRRRTSIPCARLSIPCARLSIPCARLSIPCARLSIPCARLSIPCARLSIPYARLSIPCARLSIPCARLSIPCARLSIPCARLSIPCARLSIPCARLSIPCARLSIPYARLSIPCARLSIPYARLSIPCARLSIPCARLSIPYARLSIPCARLSIPYARLSIPCARLSIPCARLSIPCARLSIPCARLSIPCARLSIPYARHSIPCARLSIPCARLNQRCIVHVHQAAVEPCTVDVMQGLPSRPRPAALSPRLQPRLSKQPSVLPPGPCPIPQTKLAPHPLPASVLRPPSSRAPPPPPARSPPHPHMPPHPQTHTPSPASPRPAPPPSHQDPALPPYAAPSPKLAPCPPPAPVPRLPPASPPTPPPASPVLPHLLTCCPLLSKPFPTINDNFQENDLGGKCLDSLGNPGSIWNHAHNSYIDQRLGCKVDALLCSECKQKYNYELQVGRVAEISGGKSPCKTIFLTHLPTYEESSTAEQSLIDILQQVFQLANLKKLRFLAIPALGTGYLNYPNTITARCMYDAVLDWAAKNPKASLKIVRFVIYNKDTEAQQAYSICHLRCQGREARLQRHFLSDGTVIATPNSGAKYRMVKDDTVFSNHFKPTHLKRYVFAIHKVLECLGCVLVPIQLNVSIGDILTTKAEAIVNGVGSGFEMNGVIAQALLKKCPNILPECQQKKDDLKKNGVEMTKVEGLSASCVIHVMWQVSLSNWRSKMTACLKKAHKHSLKSVAFPVLGSACKTFLPDHLYITAQVTRAPFKKRNHLCLFQPARPSSQTICTSRRRSHAHPSRNAIILVCSSLQDLPPRPFVHHGAACKTFLPDHLYITAQVTRAPFKKRNHLSLFQPARPSSQTICTSRRRSHAPPSRNAIILVCSSLQDLPPRPFVHHGAGHTRPFKKRNHLSLFHPARPSSQTICTSRRRTNAPPSRNAIILVCSSLQDLPPRPFVHHGAACKTFLPDHLYITAQDKRAPFKKRNHLSLFHPARPSSQTICTSRRRSHAPPSRNAIILVCSSLQDLPPRPFVHHGAACNTFLPDHLYITAQDTRAPFKKRNHLSLFQPARPSSQTICTSRRRTHAPPSRNAIILTFLPDHLYITAQVTRAPFKKRNHLSLFQPARPSSQTICTSRRRSHAPPSRNAIILVCSSLQDLPPRPFVHHGAACKTFLPDHLYITAQDTRAPFKKRNHLTCKTFLPDHLYITAQVTRAPFKKRNHLSLFQPARPSAQTICTSRRRSHAPPSRNAIILVCSSLQDLPPRPFVHHGAACKTFLPDHLYITAQVTRAPFKKRNHLSLFQPARPSSQTICTSRRRSHAPPSRNAIILVFSSLQDLPPRPFVHHGAGHTRPLQETQSSLSVPACKTFLPDHLYITAQVTRAPFKKRNHLSLFQPARPSSQTICTSRRRSHAPPSRNAIILVCSSLQDLPPRPFVHHGAACKTFLPDHLYITAQVTRAPFKKRNHLSLFQLARPSSQTICTSRRRTHAPPSRNAIILVCSSLQDLPPRPFVHHGAACKTFLPDHLYITAQVTRAPFKKRNHLSLFQPARPSSQTICTSRRRSHAPPSRNAIILVCSSLQDLPPRPFVHHGQACKTFLPDHLYITAQVTRAPFKKRNHLSLFQPARPSSQTIYTSRRQQCRTPCLFRLRGITDISGLHCTASNRYRSLFKVNWPWSSLVRAVLLRRAVLGADMRPAPFGTSVEIPRQSQNMAKKDLLLVQPIAFLFSSADRYAIRCVVLSYIVIRDMDILSWKIVLHMFGMKTLEF